MPKSCFRLLTFFLFLDGALFASPAEEKKSPQTLQYQIDASVTFLEKLSMPARSYVQPSLAGPRTLGLSELNLGIFARADEWGGAELKLRPDYSLYKKEGDRYYDFDRRSGSSYRKTETVKLLNEYSIYIDPVESMHLSVGVYRDLDDKDQAYEEKLGFAGRTEFIRNSSGLRISWNRSAVLPRYGHTHVRPKLTLDVWLLQGDEDRAETYLRSDVTYDEGAVSEDSNVYGAGRIGYMPLETLSISLMLGHGSQLSNAGKVEESFGQLKVLKAWQIFTKTWNMSFDFRFAKETFSVEQVNLPFLVQQGLDFKNAFGFNKDTAALFGARYGQSHRHNSQNPTEADVYTMEQYEVGIQHKIHRDLSLVVLGSWEKQIQKLQSGETKGAFINAETHDKITNKRFLFELDYSLRGPAI